MPKLILLDEFHLTVFARPGLREETYQAMLRMLGTAGLHVELRAP